MDELFALLIEEAEQRISCYQRNKKQNILLSEEFILIDKEIEFHRTKIELLTKGREEWRKTKFQQEEVEERLAYLEELVSFYGMV